MTSSGAKKEYSHISLLKLLGLGQSMKSKPCVLPLCGKRTNYIDNLGNVQNGVVESVNVLMNSMKLKTSKGAVFVPLDLLLVNKRKRPLRLKSIRDMKKDIDLELCEVIKAEEEYSVLETYIKLLASALKINPQGAGIVELQGMQAVQHLIDRKDPPPSCPICLSALNSPVCTECIHIFCYGCLSKHAMAMAHLNHLNTVMQFPCPLCRSVVRKREVILILPSQEESNDEDIENVNTMTVQRAHPTYFPAKRSSTRQLSQFARSLTPLAVHVEAGSEVIHQDFLRVLTHLTKCRPMSNRSARSTYQSPKTIKVLADICEIAKENNGKGKCVVFSQFQFAIQHLFVVLGDTNIGATKIIKGDKQESLHNAIKEFNNNPTIQVLLLHSSTAAAGLTLTIARHVLLLEPFIQQAEEAQAINRVHRIGQEETEVVVHRYYLVDSIEERIISWRKKESENNPTLSAPLPIQQDNKSSHAVNKLGIQFLKYVAGIQEN